MTNEHKQLNNILSQVRDFQPSSKELLSKYIRENEDLPSKIISLVFATVFAYCLIGVGFLIFLGTTPKDQHAIFGLIGIIFSAGYFYFCKRKHDRMVNNLNKLLPSIQYHFLKQSDLKPVENKKLLKLQNACLRHKDLNDAVLRLLAMRKDVLEADIKLLHLQDILKVEAEIQRDRDNLKIVDEILTTHA